MSGKTVPLLAAVAAPHWEAAARGELSLPRCASCDTVFYPPSRFCPACLSEEIGWHSVPSSGTVLSWCIFHKAYYKDFWLDPSYIVLLVRLDSGPQLYGNFVDNKEVLVVGMRVQAVFTPVNDTQALVQFSRTWRRDRGPEAGRGLERAVQPDNDAGLDVIRAAGCEAANAGLAGAIHDDVGPVHCPVRGIGEQSEGAHAGFGTAAATIKETWTP